MSEADIELIRRQFATFSTGDFEASTAELDPNVEWSDPPELPGATTHVTPAAVRRFFETFTEAWERWGMEPEAIDKLSEGTYLATVIFTGRGMGSHIEGEVRFWSLWRFRNGRPVRVENYLNRDDAERAASITSAGNGE